MSEKTLHHEMEKLLSQEEDSSESMIDKFKELIQKYGIEGIKEWRNLADKTKNTIIHELADKNCIGIIQYLVCECHFDVNIHRESDGKTPLELAQQKGLHDMICLLEDLSQNKMFLPTPDEDASEPDYRRKLNIVWIDLEMTSIEDPKIMECAVIITDKYLKSLAEGRVSTCTYSIN